MVQIYVPWPGACVYVLVRPLEHEGAPSSEQTVVLVWKLSSFTNPIVQTGDTLPTALTFQLLGGLHHFPMRLSLLLLLSSVGTRNGTGRTISLPSSFDRSPFSRSIVIPLVLFASLF